MRLLDTWGELVTAILLVIGLIVSLFIGSFVVNSAVILICGVLIGRLYYIKKHNIGFLFYFISAGFLIGYIIGSLATGYGAPLTIIILFFIGTWLGNLIMRMKLVK